MTKIVSLSHQQSQVYLATLELGTTTIQQIAKKANLPRSTCYLIIDKLKTKGLLSQTKKGKKTFIVAESPTKLLQLIKQRQKKLENDFHLVHNFLPQLEAIYNAKKNKPAISFYEGFEGIKTILEKSLKAKEIFVICSGYQKPMNKKLSNYMFNVYLPATDKVGIKTREIITKDPDLKRYLREYASANHQIKISDQPPAQSHIDKLIFNSTVALISYDTLTSTVIEHSQIAAFEKILFGQLWNRLR